jgi:hypothetical protein
MHTIGFTDGLLIRNREIRRVPKYFYDHEVNEITCVNSDFIFIFFILLKLYEFIKFNY